MRYKLTLAAVLAVCCLLGGCAAAFLVNQATATVGADATAIDSSDRAAIEAGNFAAVRARYERQPAASLSVSQLALLCDIYLKYQELGLAGDCLDGVADRIASAPGGRSGVIAHALPGKRALLALSLGQPRVAVALLGNDNSIGGQYVRALAAIQSRDVGRAAGIAGDLRRYEEPAPRYYAASIYEGVEDYQSALRVLEDPRGRLLKDYGLAGFTNTFGVKVQPGVFRLDIFDEFNFGVFGDVSLAPAGNVYVEYLAARAYLRTGQDAEAQRRLDLILAFPGIEGFRDVYWRALSDRAELSQRAGDTAAAERQLRKSIDVIERVRDSVASSAARIAIIGDKNGPYNALVDLLAARGDVTEAVVYSERAHSRTLVELLAGRSHFAGAAQGAVSGADRLVAEFDRLGGEVQIAATAAPGTTTTRLAEVYEAKRRLQQSAPAVADLVAVAPVDLRAVQARLGPREVAVVFFEGPTIWHVFTVERGRVTDHPAPATELLRNAVAMYNGMKENGLPGWQEPATALYRIALGPALSGISADTLIIVPAGFLYYVPFAALYDGQQFLIDRFAVRTVPNLSLLTRAGGGTRTGRTLVVGDPLKGSANSLQFAEQEALDVAGRIPGPTLLLGRAATVAAFRANTAGREVIHFAGHGLFNPDQPLDSQLLFTTSSGEVAGLTARDLYDIRTDARLVFLSACETGLNRLVGGQDIVGLERGFFYSGSSTVIASLWRVNDEATPQLVRAFYTAWLGGAPVEQALRSAQIATRAVHPHPNLWAAFQVASAGGS